MNSGEEQMNSVRSSTEREKIFKKKIRTEEQNNRNLKKIIQERESITLYDVEG